MGRGFAGKQEAEQIIRTTLAAFTGAYPSTEAYLDAISESLHGLEGRLFLIRSYHQISKKAAGSQ